MKKIVCLFACLFSLNLNAMGDDFQLKNQRSLFIICISRSTSTGSLHDCPVISPARIGCCPVKSPKPLDGCPVPTPSPRKKANNIALEEGNYWFLAIADSIK